MPIPRNEYPRPQFVRDQWLCLNGTWEFEIDQADSGLERGLLLRPLTGRITVPFCPESKLSGVGNTDFLNAVWYRRTVEVPAAWAGSRVLLHFQAVDYDATVWASTGAGGTLREVFRHRGGFTPSTIDLGAVAGQTLTLLLRARDNNRQPQPRGKQSQWFGNAGCHYTRTTGIWQTVWMEPVPQIALSRTRITPDLGNRCFHLEQPLSAGGPGPHQPGLQVRATLSDAKGMVSTATVPAVDFSPRLILPVPADRCRLWSPADPHLYSLKIELLDLSATVLDTLQSYAGLRSITLDGRSFKINGQSIFQRLVLDQGYYPEGILTAPSDAALVSDITLSMAAGFNGARLHEKVFEERFLHHADRLGYLVWGEFPDWGGDCHGVTGLDHGQKAYGPDYVAQWLESLLRDYSHPAIIGWCGLNESGQALVDGITVLDDVTSAMYLAAKATDTTRPVLDASGWSHRVRYADLYDCHDYEQDPAKLAQRQAGLKPGHEPEAVAYWTSPGPNRRHVSIPYGGQPYFVSEFGGIKWTAGQSTPTANSSQSWGYGQPPQTLEAFYARFAGQCRALLDDPGIFGYCYTQLTDVFQEQNGIYAFDRTAKFDNALLRAAQQHKAAIE